MLTHSGIVLVLVGLVLPLVGLLYSRISVRLNSCWACAFVITLFVGCCCWFIRYGLYFGYLDLDFNPVFISVVGLFQVPIGVCWARGVSLSCWLELSDVVITASRVDGAVL